MPPSPEVEQAIAALKAGQKMQAQALLAKALRQDPNDERAWLLMGHVLEDPARKRECLQRVLALNPGNEIAHRLLAALDPPAGPAPAAAVTPPGREEAELTRPSASAGPVADSGVSQTAAPPAPEPEQDPFATASPAATGDFARIEASSPALETPPAFTTSDAVPLTDVTSPAPETFVTAEPLAAAEPSAAAEPPAATGAAAPGEVASSTTAPASKGESKRGGLLSFFAPREEDPNRRRLVQAVNMIEKGQTEEGRAVIEDVLAHDPRNEDAWLWLAAIAQDADRKRECLRHALEINPNSKMGRRMMAGLEQPAPAPVETARPAEPPPANIAAPPTPVQAESTLPALPEAMQSTESVEPAPASSGIQLASTTFGRQFAVRVGSFLVLLGVVGFCAPVVGLQSGLLDATSNATGVAISCLGCGSIVGGAAILIVLWAQSRARPPASSSESAPQ